MYTRFEYYKVIIQANGLNKGYEIFTISKNQQLNLELIDQISDESQKWIYL